MQRTTGAGKQTVGFSKDGTPMATPGVPQITPDGGATPKVTNTGSVTNPSGNPVGVTGTARPVAVEVGKAIAKAAFKLVGVLAAGGAIYDLVKELGAIMSRNPTTGAVEVNRTWFYGDSGKEYDHPSLTGSQGVMPSTWGGAERSCKLYADAVVSYSGAGNRAVYISTTQPGGPGTALFCTTDWYRPDNSFIQRYVDGLPVRSCTTCGPNVTEAWSQAQLESAIASKSGWPSNSDIGRAMVQAADVNGERIPLPAPTVTGPATTPGTTKTTTSTNPDGSTRTQTATTVHNHTYAGDTITTNNVTTINITNNGTLGSNTTEQATETTPSADEKKTECERQPGTLGCVKELDVPAGTVAKETKTLTYVEESVFGAGACPTDVMANVGTLGQTIKVWDWQKTCSLAVPLRALVISLATFAAFLIVMPGKVET
jgi:hypothetical protein